MSESSPLLSDEEEEDKAQVPCLCSQRWIFAYVGWMGCVMLYAARVDLSVAIVCMVNNTDTNKSSTENEHAEFYWSKGEQSGLLSAYFYGYIVTQIPAGWLAGRYGGKHVILVGMLIGSLASLLLPVGARNSLFLAYVLRIALGIAQGVLFPSLQSMWGKWAPPLERSKLTALCYSGTQFGSIATFSLSGIMCKYGFDNGWGSIFYLAGGFSVLWCGLWYIFIASSPSRHPRITDSEKKYIVSSIGDKRESYPVPWVKLLTSSATWACVICQVCSNWVTYTLLTNMPTYLNEVLQFDIAQNGLLSSVPYVSQALSSILSGQLADYLRSHRYLSTTATRRIFQSIGFLGAGACLIGNSFVEDRYVAVGLLAVALGFIGMGAAGFTVNTVDFAPRFAGVLFGIANAAGTVPGMVAPLLAGALTPNKSQEEWRNVFYICGGFCVLGTLVFGTMARGELQPWAVDDVVIVVPNPIDGKGKHHKGFKDEQFTRNRIVHTSSDL